MRLLSTIKLIIIRLIKVFKGYTPDYNELLIFEKEFKDVSKIKDLYYKVHTFYCIQSDNERKRTQVMIEVSLEELDKINMHSIFISIFVLYMTVMKDMYLKTMGNNTIILPICLMIILIFMAILIKRCIFYSRYYRFLLNIILKIDSDLDLMQSYNNELTLKNH